MATVLIAELTLENVEGGVPFGSKPKDPDAQMDLWRTGLSCGHSPDSVRSAGGPLSPYPPPPVVGGVETCPICGN